MSNLDDVLNGAFIEQEQQETKSKQIEDRIKSYDGASALLPSRQYGKPVNPEKFGLTLRSIIERNDPHLAAFLGISTGCLLYTSPSPRDRTRSRMPSSA